MTTWSTLNVAYDGDWEMPDLFLREITGKHHPYKGFDLLLYAYSRDDRTLPLLREIAAEHGDPEFMVQADGCDTSGTFTVQEVTVDGDVTGTYSKQPLENSWQEENWSEALDRVGFETGYRPSLGGNYE